MENVKKDILLLSTGDVNGAYEAIYRLAKHFHAQGHKVAMLVQHKTQSDSFVIQYRPINEKRRKALPERVALKVYERLRIKTPLKPKVIFDSNYDFISSDEITINVSANQIIQQIGFTPAYIYSGMTNGFMNSTDLLKLQQLTKAQVYNITVDMNHFTGGCHFAWDCKGYIKGCSQCPAILSEAGKDIAKLNFDTKLKNAQLGNFKIIAGSGWTLNQARESKIYKNQNTIFNINSLIDTQLFNSKNKDISKRVFDLEDTKFYILMGCQNANSKRKGFEYLLEALQILEKNLSEKQKNKIEVLIVSRDRAAGFNEIPFAKRYIDYIKDYRLLVLLYQAADVFVNSSIEDSGPLMVSEAMACGTPVVGFDMGVVNNMVVTGQNGYKAKLKDSKDLAKGIHTIVELSKEEYNLYSNNCVSKVEKESSFDFAMTIFDSIHKN